jgi:hypothetical protein
MCVHMIINYLFLYNKLFVFREIIPSIVTLIVLLKVVNYCSLRYFYYFAYVASYLFTNIICFFFFY